MTDPKDMTGLVERLRANLDQVGTLPLCPDWFYEVIRHGVRNMDRDIRDGFNEPAKYAGEHIAAILNDLTTLLEEVGRYREALGKIAKHESSVSDMHMECGECHDAYADDCSAMRSVARAALQQGSVDGSR